MTKAVPVRRRVAFKTESLELATAGSRARCRREGPGVVASNVAAGLGPKDRPDAERRHERDDHRRQRRLVRAGRVDEAVEGRWTVVSASRVQVVDNG